MAATAPAQMFPDEEGVALWELLGLCPQATAMLKDPSYHGMLCISWIRSTSKRCCRTPTRLAHLWMGLCARKVSECWAVGGWAGGGQFGGLENRGGSWPNCMEVSCAMSTKFDLRTRMFPGNRSSNSVHSCVPPDAHDSKPESKAKGPGGEHAFHSPSCGCTGKKPSPMDPQRSAVV